MKTQLIAVIAICICITSALFIDPINATLVVTATIQTSGTIQTMPTTSKLTVILRSVCITDLNPNQIDIKKWVDNYVTNHNYATAVTLSDMHQYGVWWYGYSFSKTSGTWMGWTYQQLKIMIDQFHYNGWEVGIETTGIAWINQEEYIYITTKHPELAFTDANGLKATGIDNAALGTKNPGYNCVVPDFFAKFATDDPINNIAIGTRLIDLYTSRLTQMIREGLEWDFWYGTDGWNGFTNEGYRWNTNQASYCYSFSPEEENEYAEWSNSILPPNWAAMSTTQRAQAIISNSTILNNWWYYWQIRFAQLYAQIKQAFLDTGRPGSFHLISSADESSEPSNSGILCPAGMYNLTLLAQFKAVDYVYVDQESAAYTGSTYSLSREQAYVGALVKMQEPTLNPIIGLQLVDWLGKGYPLWSLKQEYLSQAVNYVWYNGIQYQVSNPNIVMVQYPTTDGFSGWTKQDIDELFSFIKETANTLTNSSPKWLGPVVPIPNTKSGSFGMAWWGMNYSFAQWTWTSNLINNPTSINANMGTMLLDESLADSGPQLTGLYDIMVNQLWASGNLNLWYYENRGPASNWGISSIWGGYEANAQNALHITRTNTGNSLNYSILNNNLDLVAQAISAGYEGTTYSITSPVTEWYSGVYLPQKGFTTIATFTSDNTIAVGYYKNATSSNFLLTHLSSQPLQGEYAQLLPRSIVNKMLYWVCNCPITSSEPLLDLKILQNGASLVVPITNQKDVGNNAGSSNGWAISSTISINASALALGNAANYRCYWLSTGKTVQITDWSSIDITLNSMADVLVISPI